MQPKDIESLLVGLYCDAELPATPPALALAVQVAGAFGARLAAEILLPKIVVPGVLARGVVSGFIASETERLSALADQRGAALRDAAERAGVACTSNTTHLPHWELRDTFTRKARLHDLVVLSGGQEFYDHERDVVEGALFDSGRPLLVAGMTPGALDGPIIVAWDGSGRAARAVHDALPFLRRAPSVTLLSVTGEKDLSRAADADLMVSHLVGHGVKAAAKTIAAIDGDVAEALRREAQKNGAAMIVMGAFVHSRLRQIVFGGVTGALLRESPVPLLLSY